MIDKIIPVVGLAGDHHVVPHGKYGLPEVTWWIRSPLFLLLLFHFFSLFFRGC
jgi:hypothetical protein